MTSRVVGLTGGIAAGKSSVARCFAELGVPVVDADQLAREAVAVGSAGLAEIVRVFGREVLLVDGSLDRKVLGARVFSDAGLRAKLNAITHPRIAALGATSIAGHLARGAAYVVYEAALIVENQLQRGMHALVVVSVSPTVQLARLVLRDGMSESDALARIGAQMPLAKKLEVADYVVDNSGTVDLLRQRVAQVHADILQSLSTPHG